MKPSEECWHIRCRACGQGWIGEGARAFAKDHPKGCPLDGAVPGIERPPAGCRQVSSVQPIGFVVWEPDPLAPKKG